jgi:hypothetical protein
MEITFGLILLAIIYFLYKLLIGGWLYKTILFFSGWFGIYIILRVYVEGATNTAITINANGPMQFSWAAIVPTVICLLCLMTTKDD